MAAHTGCSSFVEEKATACHSEPFAVILSGQSEMLRFAQHDSERAQNDRQWGYPLRMTDIAYQLPAGISNLRISGGSKYTPGGCVAEAQGVCLYQTDPG